jgi:glyoxylase-like metal-dependent hydrolase (beta-lactamase superfamily II)
VTELPDDIRQVRLPMRDNPLRHINSYLLKGDDGYVLVDCGFEGEDVLEALQAALRELGIGLGDVRTLVVTHYHADHYGLSATLLRLGRLRMLLHRLDWLFIHTKLADIDRYLTESAAWLELNGLSLPRYTDDERRSLEQVRRFTVVAPHQELEDRDRIGVGRHAFRVVWTPGHTPGHVCLYDAEREILLSGDHVLDPITPNVSYWWPGAGNPLGDFLASLRKVAALETRLVLPAHGEPFVGLRRRVEELFRHHAARESAVLAALEDSPRSAAEVAERLPWTRRGLQFAELTLLQRDMAVAETISHLEELRALGQVERHDERGRLVYRLWRS